VRDRVPTGMEIAAGEYGYDSLYFRCMLEAQAVDVLQLDATRCKGFTGFLAGSAVAVSFGCPLSAHCAPSLHMHVAYVQFPSFETWNISTITRESKRCFSKGSFRLEMDY
jgi:L-alanine-DL-glutamate epimerase-like enolase superfamily enzyme